MSYVSNDREYHVQESVILHIYNVISRDIKYRILRTITRNIAVQQRAFPRNITYYVHVMQRIIKPYMVVRW